MLKPKCFLNRNKKNKKIKTYGSFRAEIYYWFRPSLNNYSSAISRPIFTTSCQPQFLAWVFQHSYFLNQNTVYIINHKWSEIKMKQTKIICQLTNPATKLPVRKWKLIINKNGLTDIKI